MKRLALSGMMAMALFAVAQSTTPPPPAGQAKAKAGNVVGSFDPAADSLQKQNPAGTWTYGFTTAQGQFQPYDAGNFDTKGNVPISIFWGAKAPDHRGTTIEMAKAAPRNGLLYPPGVLCFVSNMANKTGEMPTLRWTAPQNGTVAIKGTMAGVGLSTAGMMGIRGGAGIFPSLMDSQFVAGKEMLFGASLNNGRTGNAANFNIRRAVKKGDVIDLLVKSRKSDDVSALAVKMQIDYAVAGK